MKNLIMPYHTSGFNDCYPLDETTIRVRIKTLKSAVKAVNILYQNIYCHEENDLKEKSMKRISQDQQYDYYETDIQVSEGYFKYYFQLIADRIYTYGQDGLVSEIDENKYFYYSEAHSSDIFSFPSWAKGIIIYQIIIDRFKNGCIENDPPVTKPWNALPDRKTYYGGDIQGVIEKLPYLKILGVDAIYLNPIHPSKHYHKYDITNYEEIDPYIGDKKIFKELVDRAHLIGIRVILDGVFNHCSSEHPFFKDLIKNQEKSKYKDWFKIDSFPISIESHNYKSFGNLVPNMPKFNTDNKEVIKYLTDMVKYWTKTYSIDGWRLDVGDELSHQFLRQLRVSIKEINPETLIIGECWNIATRFMQGDQFDTITDYKTQTLILDLIDLKISLQEFIERMNQFKMNYKTVTSDYMINILSSHDTKRIASHFLDKEKELLAFAISMFLSGSFLLYYGDELGMLGEDDPDNRRAMDWSKQVDNKIRELINIRQTTRLSEGTFKIKTTKNSELIIIRETDDKIITLLSNFNHEKQKIEGDIEKIIFLQGTEEDCLYLNQFDFVIFEKNKGEKHEK